MLETVGLELWNTLREMAPYLLFGFLMAGVLSTFVLPETVEKHLGGRGMWPIIKAACVGVPLPLCSCGVIPVAASLRRHGSSRGATAAFLISTPQTGVDSIAVTYGMLGPVFAVFRPIAAFVSGLIGGWIIDAVDARQAPEESRETCDDSCCAPGRRKNRLLSMLQYGFVTLPRDLARPLMIGLLFAGIVSALVPAGFFSEKMGSNFVQMLMMMALGIPLYVCATASVPIAAAMMLKGISPGSALVFLMTGPATNAATIATIWKIMGKRFAAIYLAVIAGTALASGILLDSLFIFGSFSPGTLSHEMLPDWLHTASAFAVLIMLATTLIRPSAKHLKEVAIPDNQERTELKIKGMTCSHCADTVQRSLQGLPGVASAKVSLSDGIAEVTGANHDVSVIIKAVEETG